jgi:hypothetical protein
MTNTDTLPETVVASLTPVVRGPDRTRNRIHHASLFIRASIARRRRRWSRRPDRVGR